MGSPCHHDFRFLDFLVFLDGDHVCESLERMPCGRFHAEHRFSRVFNELVEYGFVVVFLLVFETGEGAHSYDVAIAAHHRDGFKKVLRLVSVHYHPSFGFEFPCALVHIEDYHIHPEVETGFLGAEPGPETGVEEYHQEGLVAPELLVGERVFLYIFCFGKGFLEVAKLLYGGECFHFLQCFDV